MEQRKRRAWVPTATVAQRVREARRRRGLTAEKVAELLAEQGVHWERSTVAKLENDKRQNVTVAELLALAVVLHVAPVHLLVPTNAPNDEEYAVTAATTAKVGAVREWVRGNLPLDGTDWRTYFGEVPEQEWRTRVAQGPGNRFGIEVDDGSDVQEAVEATEESIMRRLGLSEDDLQRRLKGGAGGEG